MKKLEGNGLWESSRMMLPEHKESALALKKEIKRIKAPDIDEQKREIMNGRLSAAIQDRLEVRLTLYADGAMETVRGFVGKTEPYRQRLQISGRWVSYKQICEVEIEPD